MTRSAGQSLSITDPLDPARAAALHATLGLPGTPPKSGEAMPPFWQQIYFWDAQPPARLGPDGHVQLGSGLIPDLGLPIRMWAGGRLQFDAPVLLGHPAERRSIVEATTRKQGRSGPLGFVTLRHEIWQESRLCLTEHQDIVYRMPRSDTGPASGPPSPVDETIFRPVSFDSTLLFRYSALTFNGHRIHYDLDYARRVEGYAGLVVHGPLMAQLLILLAEEEMGGLTRFSFRATAPLILGEDAELCRKDGRLWVRGPDGRLCMEAEAG